MGMIVELALWILFLIYTTVVMWKVFVKAGRPGWASLIPFYNLYTLLKITDKPAWWMIPLCVPIINLFFTFFVVFTLARYFGKKRTFALGLFFLGPIFYGILAFGRAKFEGGGKCSWGSSANSLIAVFNREMDSYFTTPLAYVFLVIFLFFSGYLAFKEGFYAMRQADLSAFFKNLPLLFVFMVPSTAMRLWAEERKVGSIELLLTLPITIPQAVLGKFFAAWLFLGIALALTFPMVITVSYLGDPDGGLIVTGYLGSMLMAGGFLAIGCFFSALSKNQVISFVLSVVACAVLVFAGMPTTLNYISTFFPAGLVSAVEGMSFQTHFESMQKGVLKFGDLSYFVLLIVGWIAACTIVLDERKAR